MSNKFDAREINEQIDKLKPNLEMIDVQTVQEAYTIHKVSKYW